LNKLSLAFNRIKHIPAWLFILPLLKILILSGNRIEELPTEEEVGSAML
jgi:Leucine-rich repeat (LRR) protein